MLGNTSWVSAGASVAISKRFRASYWACWDVNDFVPKFRAAFDLTSLGSKTRKGCLNSSPRQSLVKVSYSFSCSLLSAAFPYQPKGMWTAYWMMTTYIVFFSSLNRPWSSIRALLAGSLLLASISCLTLFISKHFRVSLVVCCRQQNFSQFLVY